MAAPGSDGERGSGADGSPGGLAPGPMTRPGAWIVVPPEVPETPLPTRAL